MKSARSSSLLHPLPLSKAGSSLLFQGQEERNLACCCDHRNPSRCPPGQEFPFSKGTVLWFPPHVPFLREGGREQPICFTTEQGAGNSDCLSPSLFPEGTEWLFFTSISYPSVPSEYLTVNLSFLPGPPLGNSRSACRFWLKCTSSGERSQHPAARPGPLALWIRPHLRALMPALSSHLFP